MASSKGTAKGKGGHVKKGSGPHGGHIEKVTKKKKAKTKTNTAKVGNRDKKK